ncbi:MAG: hypothetical protein WC044_01850 [Crocinitomicaceae bacterium]
MKKQVIYSSLMFLSLVFLFGTATSCNRKGCTDSAAENYSSKSKKDDGSCTYARTKFLGTYATNENCSSGTDSYSISVTESSTGKALIVISNFYNISVTVTATVTGSTFSFNETKSGINFSGSGSISGSALTINFTASAGGATDVCTMNCIKQ